MVTWYLGTAGRVPSQPLRFYVDAMNVIGSRPDGWWKDKDAAMAGLVAGLELLADADGDEITVVFERRPRPPVESELVEVAHAPVREQDAADNEIVRRIGLEADPGSITVYTSDKRLAGRVKAIGASVESASALRRRLEAVAGKPGDEAS